MIAINPVLTFVATVAALYERRQCNIIEIVDGRRPPLQLIFPITVLRIIECLSTLGLLSIERGGFPMRNNTTSTATMFGWSAGAGFVTSCPEILRKH
jgi:hypothetical protein